MRLWTLAVVLTVALWASPAAAHPHYPPRPIVYPPAFVWLPYGPVAPQPYLWTVPVRVRPYGYYRGR